MRNILYILLIFIVSTANLQAQQIQQYTQYFNNPYLYNPAYAGYDKSPVLYATHRQQWLGFEGAPVTTNLSFHSPLGNKSPIALGANINNDQFGLINNFSARFTFAYLVPLSVEAEHYLKFGLSGGVGMNQVDLSDVNIGDDITLSTINNSSIYPDAQFGIQYHFQRLNIGFALPRLLGSPYSSNSDTSPLQISEMAKYLAMLSYRFNFGTSEAVAFEPMVMYQVTETNKNRIEALGILHIKDVVWVGGGYQQELGYAATLGVKTKKLSIGYSYGMGGSEITSYGNGTHEIQVGLILGKKREMLTRKPRLTRSTQGDAIPEEILAKKKKKSKKESKEDNSDEETKVQQTEPPKDLYKPLGTENIKLTIDSADQVNMQKNQVQAPTTLKTFGERSWSEDTTSVISEEEKLKEQEEKEKLLQENKSIKVSKQQTSQHPLEMKAGNYVITGTFSQQGNADKLSQRLSEEGFDVRVGYNTEKGYYYVYLYQTGTLKEIVDATNSLRSNSAFKDAWILIVEE